MAKKQQEENRLPDLKQSLKNKDLGRLYIFHGEETFLLNYYLTQVKKQRLDPLTESFNFHRFNNETFSLDAFADAIDNYPMMAEYSLVQVEDIDIFKMNESDREKMAGILQDIPDYCTVLFTYLTVGWKPDKRFKKLWDAVESHAVIVEFAKQQQRDLIAWVGRHFAAHKKRIPGDLCAYLIEITGGTMTALNSEIEKICAYSGAEEIRKSDIDAVTEPVLDAVVFQMTDMISAGAYEQAFGSLQNLLKMQEDPIQILGAIGGHIRRLGAARTLLDKGKGSFDLQKLTGLHEYPAKKTMEAARRIRPEFCRKAAELILETDHNMKTSFDDNERLLELLIFNLAMEARNG